MRCVLGSLLAAALLVGLAHSLRCHSCVSTTLADCNSPSTCSGGQNYCFKFDGTTPITQELILKGCVANCQGDQITGTQISGSLSCCTTDLCNGAAANGMASVRTIYAALCAAVGVTALLLGMGL